MPSCKDMNTPFYLIDIGKAKANLLSFHKSIEKHGRNDSIAYSIKANYNDKIIKSFYDNMAMFEVASIFELNKLIKNNVETKRIIINSLFNNSDIFYDTINSGTFAIISSYRELEWLIDSGYNVNIGVRINLDFIKNESALHTCKNSRFGFDVNDKKFHSLIAKNSKFNLTCLSCHLAGNTRDPSIYADITNSLCNIILQYNLDRITTINIGGGYKIDSKFWSFDNYVSSVVSALKSNRMEHIKVIYEPGNSLVRNALSYTTSVIDVKILNKMTYVTVDGTSLHLKNVHGRFPLDCKIDATCNEIMHEQIIVGNTCKESDILIKLKNTKRLFIGDVLRFDNLGAYLVNEIPAFLLDYPNIFYR